MNSEQVFRSGFARPDAPRLLFGWVTITFSAAELEGKSVKLLKIALAMQTGVTRFRQRWLSENHAELHDDDVVLCCDVQLVVLPFVQAKSDEIRQLLSACKENHPDKLVDLLRRPLNPDRLCERRGFLPTLHLAAQNGHLQIVQLLIEADADVNIAYESMSIFVVGGQLCTWPLRMTSQKL